MIKVNRNEITQKIKDQVPEEGWMSDVSQRVAKGEIWQHSTFITYYVLLTAFPLVVGIINGLQQFNRPLNQLMWLVLRIAPEPLAERVMIDLEIIYARSNVGIFIFAVISTIWTVSWTMAALLMGLNRAYGVDYRKNIVVLRILAFLLTFIFAAWVVCATLFIQQVTNTSMGRWGLFIPVLFSTIALIYYLLPNIKQKFRFVLPGALFTTGSILLAIFMYRLFLEQLPEDSTFFTLMGSFMVLLALLQKSCLAILAGGSINATFIKVKEGKVIPKANESKFVRFLRQVKILDKIKD